MKKVMSFVNIVVIAVLLSMNSCEQESLSVQKGSGADCDGCADPGPGTFSDEIGQPPVIKSFSPKKGFSGTRVTIKGSRFSSTPAFNIVSFDGVPAMVSSATTTTLSVVVPPGATTGKIKVSVSGLSSLSAVDFDIVDIPKEGLVAFYPLDGSADDASVNENHGILFGAVPAADHSGVASRALYFDGLSHLDMGNPPGFQFGNEITISVWIKLQSQSGAILSKSAAAPHQNGYFFYYKPIAGSAEIGEDLRTYSSSVCTHFFGPLRTTLSTWTCFTITIKGSQRKFYKDGLLISTMENMCPLEVTSDGHLLMGAVTGNSWSKLVGYIDDVAMYNRALRDAEVLALYQQPIIP